MKILATDLDRTLLPNGKWEKNENAINLFNTLTLQNPEIIVIYVTGRSKELTQKAIDKYNIRYPNILIGDVGTTIRYYKNQKWFKEEKWNQLIIKKSPKWDNIKIKNTLNNIKGLKEQEKSKLNEFKQSYYIDPNLKKEITIEINKKIKGKYSETIIYSYDPLINKGLVDILPNSATKETSIKHIMNLYQLKENDVLYCGDSGNDILPLTSGFNAVLVKNTDQETKKTVKEIINKKNLLKKLYIAKGNFKNLNGNYTSGVIEGAYHFEFFK